MSRRLRAPILLLALATLVVVVTPPVVEDHREPGFCSADCPVQHPGHGTAIGPSPVPSAARRSPVVVAVIAHAADAALAAAAAPDAPRAPPAA